MIGTGPMGDLVPGLKAHQDLHPNALILCFNDLTGQAADLPVTEHSPKTEGELAQRSRGRPKLGVFAREVTLLPRHWDWLSAQPGGASVTLRKLIDQARKAEDGWTQTRRQLIDRTYRIMTALGGDRPGYEEACRALYADDDDRFFALIAPWPQDLVAYIGRLLTPES